jgi:hypothetical protein
MDFTLLTLPIRLVLSVVALGCLGFLAAATSAGWPLGWTLALELLLISTASLTSIVLALAVLTVQRRALNKNR